MVLQPTILLVEDEPDVRDLVAGILSQSGFGVFTAADGVEAMRILAERAVDLLFTDIVLPGMNGFELAEKAKTLRPALRVLYTTGYSEHSAAGNGGRHGKLIPKPFHPSHIVSEIKKALSGSG